MLASSWLETAEENGVQGSSLGHHPGHSKASFQQEVKVSTCPHPEPVTYLSCISLRRALHAFGASGPSLMYLHGQRRKPRTSCSDALPFCAFHSMLRYSICSSHLTLNQLTLNCCHPKPLKDLALHQMLSLGCDIISDETDQRTD